MSYSSNAKLQLFLFISILSVMAIFALVVIIIGIIAGSNPPGNLPQCIVPTTVSGASQRVFNQKFQLLSISRLANDPSLSSVQVVPSQNFVELGLWNLLDGVQINQGDTYTFTANGQIAIDSGAVSQNFALNTTGPTNSYSTSVYQGERIILLLNASGYLAADKVALQSSNSGVVNTICGPLPANLQGGYNNEICFLRQGYGLVVTLNGSQIKSALTPLGNQVMNIDQIKAQNPSLSIPQSLSGKVYVYQIFDISESGTLKVSLMDGLVQPNMVIGNIVGTSYSLSIVHTGTFAQNGEAETRMGSDNGSIQISLRNDNAPQTWVSNGQDNTPEGEYQSLTNGSLSQVADANYTQVWIRVKDTDYSNNLGYYNVYYNNIPADQTTNSTSSSTNSFSSFIGDVFQQYTSILSEASLSIYTNLTSTTNGSQLVSIIRLMLTLYVVIYGIFLLFGLTKVSNQEFGIKIFKFGLILIMFSDKSWYFFSQYFFNIFLDGTTVLVNKATDQTSDVTNQFAFVDTVITAFFAPETWNNILAMLMKLPMGWVMAVMLLYTMVLYMIIIFDIVAVCFTSMILISLLIAVFPIFFSLILFTQTKKMFDQVIKMLSDFTLRTIILFVGLIILQNLINTFFAQATSFQSCWGTIFTINIIKIINIPVYGYQLTASNSNFLLTLFINVLAFYIVVKFLSTFVEFIPNVTGRITGNFSTFFTRTFAGGGGGGLVSGLLNSTLTTIGIKANETEKANQQGTKMRDSIKRYDEKVKERE